MVIFRPTILAEQDAQADLGATNSDFHRLQRSLHAGAFLSTQLVQAIKIAAIIKLTVIGQRIFDDEAASLIAAQQLAILAHKGGVILAQASILV